MANHTSRNTLNVRTPIERKIYIEAQGLLQRLDENGLSDAAAIMSLAVDAIAKRVPSLKAGAH